MADYRPQQAGFTLIEMMVTLVLLGLVVGLVLPNLNSIYNSTSASVTRSELEDQFNRLGVNVASHAKALTVSGENIRALVAIPQDYEIMLPQPLAFSALGVCKGGHVIVEYQREVIHSQRLTRPYCHLDFGD